MTSATIDTSTAFAAADASEKIEKASAQRIEDMVSSVEPHKLKNNYLWGLENGKNYTTYIISHDYDRATKESLIADGRIVQRIKDVLPDTVISLIDADVGYHRGCNGEAIEHSHLVAYIALNVKGVEEIGEHLYRLKTPPMKRIGNFVKDRWPFRL